MSKQKKVKFRSISKELLKVVFVFYFSVTILLTLLQFIVEYYHAKENIKSELTMISTTFEDSLNNAMWNFDTKQITSICDGILKLPSVLAIEVLDKNTQNYYYTKFTNNLNPNSVGIFSYSVDIKHKQRNSLVYIGTVKYYSNSDIVFDRVKLSFFIIFLSSLFKSLLLTILFIWAFKKYLITPLEEITDSIHTIELKKLEQQKLIKVDHTKNNELVYLGDAFNKMIKKLSMQLKQLQDTQHYLLESEKMVSLGNMVAGVAHEINTPVGMALTGITHLEGETNNIKKLYEDENMSEDDFKEYLDINIQINKSIQINLNKAASLIKSFKKVAVDQSSNEIRRLNLKEYIDEILLSLHNKIKHTKIDIRVNCDENLIIYTNAGAISQIITNLIMNSLIHGFSKDQVGNIILDIKEKDDNIQLTYKDNGKGMDSKTLKRVFDPFYTTKRGQGGSGLGGSIIYNLVTTGLKGSIDVNSKLNNGVQFDITIPKELK